MPKPPPPPAARPLQLLVPPYDALRPVGGGKAQLRAEGREPGSMLLWHLADGLHEQDAAVVRDRPGGLALVVVLPPAPGLATDGRMAHLLGRVRPYGILPHHEDPSLDDLTWVLRRPPADLPAEVTEYLAWRGIPMDRETRRLVRRTLELSAELRTVTGLARALYMSRRALGRRLLSRGLPVPSHWLHFGRLLRVALRLQTSDETVLSIGYDLGYPDAFSLSNQMVRLTGYRPSDARRRLGWEWIAEAWLRKEADTGGLAPRVAGGVLGEAPSPTPPPSLSLTGRGAPVSAPPRRRGRRLAS